MAFLGYSQTEKSVTPKFESSESVENRRSAPLCPLRSAWGSRDRAWKLSQTSERRTCCAATTGAGAVGERGQLTDCPCSVVVAAAAFKGEPSSVAANQIDSAVDGAADGGGVKVYKQENVLLLLCSGWFVYFASQSSAASCRCHF